ncbi:Holliday junction resolvase RuvX [Helicobacter anatolicus]|uniref:Holliday junction resolvase RuvX n=1 Tax=Helicobacter anatolicus TaxID=2905874 RepID=UPI001E657139|nr:Holliday junction resolvase RuvX [Helicobacter anatolicus]MCE3037758.1 Holliday junction resolvase RuvX [Helicobacter anatolicus]
MILACDIGLKRIGLAIYLNQIILPLEPILRKNRNQASNELSQLLKNRQITTLIVGIPNSQSTSAQETKKRIIFFISLLKTQAKIVFIDEDLTSFEAQSNLTYLKKEKRQEAQKNGIIDSLAACKILERYLSNPKASLIMS